MTTEPKLPLLPLFPARPYGLGNWQPKELDAIEAYGLQCFEAGRQQGMAQERERQDEENLRKAISDATQRLT